MKNVGWFWANAYATMEPMRGQRKKSRVGKVVALIGAILVLLALGLMVYENSAPRKLAKLGYSAEETREILRGVERDQLEPIFSHEYDARTDDVVREGEFRADKLADYMAALGKYEITAEELVSLVNHADYDPEETYSELEREILQEEYYLSRNYTRYLALARALEEPEATAAATAETETESVAADETESARDESAMMETRTDGSAADATSPAEAPTAAEVVAKVNSNRDREYYTEPEAADVGAEHLVLVNKYYYLEPDYEVDTVTMDASYGTIGIEMERETYAQFQKMAQAALADGVQLYVTSGYRGYVDQQEVFDSYLLEGGEAYALVYAAKPGYSEHQTGRALDIFTPGMTLTSFAGTKGANWLASEAYKYGFILRYPEDKVDLTGYEFEPWHYRYVGEAAAQEIFETGLTLEEYVAWKAE